MAAHRFPRRRKRRRRPPRTRPCSPNARPQATLRPRRRAIPPPAPAPLRHPCFSCAYGSSENTSSAANWPSHSPQGSLRSSAARSAAMLPWRSHVSTSRTPMSLPSFSVERPPLSATCAAPPSRTPRRMEPPRPIRPWAECRSSGPFPRKKAKRTGRRAASACSAADVGRRAESPGSASCRRPRRRAACRFPPSRCTRRTCASCFPLGKYTGAPYGHAFTQVWQPKHRS